MDPKAIVWYGVAGYGLELTEAAAQREDEEWLSKDESRVRSVYCSEARIGFGAAVLRHDWNDSPEALDLAAMQAKIETVKAKVDPVLDELGVTGERGVYLATDYS